MSRQTWIEGQVVTSDDLNNLTLGVEQTLLEQVLQNVLQGHEGFVVDAFKVMRASATTFTVTGGLGLYKDTTQTTPESKYRLMHNTTPSTIYTITTPHATLSRLDIVQVRFKIENEASATRDVKDGLGTVAPQSVVIRKKWTFDLQIKDGVASGSPVAPSPDAGWVKITTISVSPGATGILNQAACADNRTVLYLFDEVAAAIAAEIAARTAAVSALDARLLVLETSTGNYTQDLWQWELGSENVDTVAASTNDLVWTKAFGATTTWATALPAASTGSRYWELMWMFQRKIALKIIDGAGAVWLIVPRSPLASYDTYVNVGGTVGTANYTFTLLATGIGTVYDVYKNGTSMANFSTFTSLSSGSMNTSSFRAVLFGTKAPAAGWSSVNGVALFPEYPKKKWFRFILGTAAGAGPGSSEVFGVNHQFTYGRRYRVTLQNVNFTQTGSNTEFALWFSNHPTALSVANQIYNNTTAVLGSGLGIRVDACFNFTAMGNGIVFQMNRTIPFFSLNYSGLNTGSYALSFFKSEGRAYPMLIVEEL
jgi:hypothetical protein